MASSVSRTLIYVEDDPDMRTFIGSELRKRTNAEVIEVESCEDALRDAESRYPDAILADIVMSGMDGMELLKEIREVRGLDTPFVFLTGNVSREHLQMALRLGATNFLEKPCDINQLSKSINLAIELGAALKQMTLEIEKICTGPGISPDSLDLLRSTHKSISDLRGAGWKLVEAPQNGKRPKSRA